MEIEEILARRTDLSTFLVHLTRASDEESALTKLSNILRQQRINAMSPFGMAFQRLANPGSDRDSQKVVCFTETPLEYVNLLTREIAGRNIQFEPYGIAIARKQGRRLGVNPVWYLDITPGHDWLTAPVNTLIDQAVQAGDFRNQPIAKIAPFLEQMGTYAGGGGDFARAYRKEFWWEREWRHPGDFTLPARYIVLCPSERIREIKEVVDGLEELTRPIVSYIDPRWSLEMIIGKLAGLHADDLGAF